MSDPMAVLNDCRAHQFAPPEYLSDGCRNDFATRFGGTRDRVEGGASELRSGRSHAGLTRATWITDVIVGMTENMDMSDICSIGQGDVGNARFVHGFCKVIALNGFAHPAKTPAGWLPQDCHALRAA